MTEREALLAAVYATPDDDLPRLVYADWLDENGEPNRAEFIRRHIELPTLPPRPTGDDDESVMAATEHDLSHVTVTSMLSDPGPLVEPTDREAVEQYSFLPVFERGFLCGVTFPGVQWPADRVDELAPEWHRVCDLIARNPLVNRVTYPDWFVLTCSATYAGNWQATLRFDHPLPCPECRGAGWVPGAIDCGRCDGGGHLVGRTAVVSGRDGLAATLLGTIGRELFGQDHPLFQGGVDTT